MTQPENREGLGSIFRTTFDKTKAEMDKSSRAGEVRPGVMRIGKAEPVEKVGQVSVPGNFRPRPLPFTSLPGLPEDVIQRHYGLYLNYLAKLNDCCRDMEQVNVKEVFPQQAAYSPFESMATKKSFLANAVQLHELYFENLGPTPVPPGGSPLLAEVNKLWGSFEHFKAYLRAMMAVSHGWTLLVWWPRAIEVYGSGLRVFNMGAHDIGGVPGAVPLLVFDAYEHSYVNALVKAEYIVTFLTYTRWDIVNRRFVEARGA